MVHVSVVGEILQPEGRDSTVLSSCVRLGLHLASVYRLPCSAAYTADQLHMVKSVHPGLPVPCYKVPDVANSISIFWMD